MKVAVVDFLLLLLPRRSKLLLLQNLKNSGFQKVLQKQKSSYSIFSITTHSSPPESNHFIALQFSSSIHTSPPPPPTKAIMDLKQEQKIKDDDPSNPNPKTTLTTYPPGTEALSIQVAGHVYTGTDTGMLRHTASGDILKLVKEERFRREWLFYKEVFDDSAEDSTKEDLAKKMLRPLLPTYKGVLELGPAPGDLPFMRLADVAFYGSHPTVMDIKIGKRTYGPDATEKKKDDERKKYRFQEELGFRVLGMMIYKPGTSNSSTSSSSPQNYIRHDKSYGKQFAPPSCLPLPGFRDIVEAVSTDFCADDLDLLRRFRSALEPVAVWFRRYNRHRWCFASSSLLFAYSGGGDKTSKPPEINIKMIDFAHVSDNSDPGRPELDENYLHGLQQLIATFDRAIEIQEKKLQK